jgi:hypothetical protein
MFSAPLLPLVVSIASQSSVQGGLASALAHCTYSGGRSANHDPNSSVVRRMVARFNCAT